MSGRRGVRRTDSAGKECLAKQVPRQLPRLQVRERAARRGRAHLAQGRGGLGDEDVPVGLELEEEETTEREGLEARGGQGAAVGIVRSLQGPRGGARSGDSFPGQGKGTGARVANAG